MASASLYWTFAESNKKTPKTIQNNVFQCANKSIKKLSKKYLTVGLFLWQLFLEPLLAFQMIPGATHWKTSPMIPGGLLGGFLGLLVGSWAAFWALLGAL